MGRFLHLARNLKLTLDAVTQTFAFMGRRGCHAAGQRLLMFDGTLKAVEDVIVGDRLMGPDSEPRTVLALKGGHDRMVRITPSHGGAPFVVNEDHILTLCATNYICRRVRGDRSKRVYERQPNTLIDVSLRDYLCWPAWKRSSGKFTLLHVSVNFGGSNEPLPLDAYSLGVLLGDGHMKQRVSVTNVDDAVVQSVYDLADRLSLLVRVDTSKGSRTPSYALTNGKPYGNRPGSNPLINVLRDLKLWGHGAATKFVPQQYKTASRQDRLALLAGLMDTDGSLGSNCYDYASASKQLVEDVAFVARSVGLCVSPAAKKHVDGGTYHRICISGETSIVPCRIKRKNATRRRQRKNPLRSGFETERLDRNDYFGFTLDRDGRYLLDDLTITHNSGKTYAASKLAEEMLAVGAQIIVLDPVGNWWGLRSMADGKAGLSIPVLGGPKGDIPLEPTGGSIVADFVVETGTSLVLDVSRFRKNERKRFITDFAEQLFFKKKDAPSALHVFIDEAQHFCLREDAEVLTPSGWKRYYDLAPGKSVSTFDLDTGEYRYESVQRLIVRDHDGEMVRLETESLSCDVTPDHRVVLRRNQRAEGRVKKYDWTFCRAASVPHHIEIPAGGAPVGAGVSGLSSIDLRVMGWLITDGHVHTKGKPYYGLTQAVTTEKDGVNLASEMTRILAAYEGVSRTSRAPRDTKGPAGRVITGAASVAFFFNREACLRFREWLKDDLHRIPRMLLRDCSREQLEALWQGLLEGDGTHKKGKWEVFYPGHNEGLADDFQELATRLGYRALKRLDRNTKQWRVNLCDRRSYYVRKPKRSQYRGVVWDITVPSGAFVVRQDGTVFVTGNCPQRVHSGDERMLGAVSDLTLMGRNYGIGVSLVSQRPQKVNKDVLNQTECLFTFQMTGPHERKAIKEWIAEKGIVDADPAAITKLPTGTAIVWSPQWLDFYGKVKINKKKTADTSATPKTGKKRAPKRKLAKVDLEAIAEAMSSTIEAAKQTDPKHLRARLSHANTKIVALQTALDAQVPKVEEIKVPVITDEQLERLERAIERLYGMGSVVDDSIAALRDGLADSFGVKLGSPTKRNPPTKRKPPVKVVRVADGVLGVAAAPVSPEGSNGLGSGPLKILVAIASLHPKKLTRSQVSTLSGFSVKSSTFSNYLSALRTGGYIVGSGAVLYALTDKGREVVGDVTVPRSTDQLVALWVPKLTGNSKVMLQLFVDAYPNGLSRDEIGEQAGHSTKSSTFSNYLSALTSNMLVEKRDGLYYASDSFFPARS